MSLLTVTLPAQKLELIKYQINSRHQRLATASDSQREGLLAEIANLQKVLSFVEDNDPATSFSKLEFSTDYAINPGVSVNLDIVLSLCLPGTPSYLQDATLINQLNSQLYPQETALGLRPQYEITFCPHLFFAHFPNDNFLRLVKVTSLNVSSVSG